MPLVGLLNCLRNWLAVDILLKSTMTNTLRTDLNCQLAKFLIIVTERNTREGDQNTIIECCVQVAKLNILIFKHVLAA